MDREEILLKEYELCQEDSSSMVSVHWTVAGIFLGINTALLGWILHSVISRPLILENSKGLVLIIGIVIIVLIALLLLWLNRINHLTHINNFRMKEIEKHPKLRMWKNYIVKATDNWNELTEKEKIRFAEVRRPCFWQTLLNPPFFFLKYIPNSSAWIIRIIYVILILSWTLLIILAFNHCAREFIIR